jgi:hypothetical protein
MHSGVKQMRVRRMIHERDWHPAPKRLLRHRDGASALVRREHKNPILIFAFSRVIRVTQTWRLGSCRYHELISIPGEIIQAILIVGFSTQSNVSGSGFVRITHPVGHASRLRDVGPPTST